MKFSVEIDWAVGEVRVNTQRREFVRTGLTQTKMAEAYGTCLALLNVLFATLEMQDGQGGISEVDLLKAQALVLEALTDLNDPSTGTAQNI